MTLPNTPLVRNERNITDGGMMATLLDSAMGTLAGSTIPKDYVTVTQDIEFRYVKAAIGDL
ncbi:PaaI family thioesterase [Peribacillus muralis]|nr:DUF4442 domain-containing protein [Peribacillus muralis]